MRQCAVGIRSHMPPEFAFLFMKSMNFCNNIIWMPPLFVANFLQMIFALSMESWADRSEIIRYSGIFSYVAFTSSLMYARVCMVKDAVGELVIVVIRRSMVTVVKLPSTSVGINSVITKIFFFQPSFAGSEFAIFCVSKLSHSTITTIRTWK